MKKLIDLDPHYATGNDGIRLLVFLCPKCEKHYIGVQVSGKGKYVFETVGKNFSVLTLIPSIMNYSLKLGKNEGLNQFIEVKHNAFPEHCRFHFYVRSGEIIPCDNFKEQEG